MPTSTAFQKVKGVPNLYHRDGQFYARLTISGKQTWRSLATDKIRAAQKALAKLQTGQVTEITKRTEPTLHAAMEDAVAFRSTRRGMSRPLSAKTLTFHQDLLITAKLIFPDRRLSTFTDEEILGLIGSAKQVVAPDRKATTPPPLLGQSRRKALFELVKGSYKRAMAKGQTIKNPLEGHTPGQVPKKKRKLPSREQINEIVTTVEANYPKTGRAAGLTIRLLAFSGLRISEARSLQWADVSDGEFHVSGTKTEGADRDVEISPPLQAVFDDIEAIFGKSGKVMPLRCVRTHLKDACEKLKLQKLTNHDLRAWFVTYALQSGIDVPTVAEWIGDAPEVVLRRYTAIMDSHKKAKAKLLK